MRRPESRWPPTTYSKSSFFFMRLHMCPHTAISVAKEQDEDAAWSEELDEDACSKPLAAYHICEVQLILRDFASVFESIPLP